jgi:PAS domain-containing protein
MARKKTKENLVENILTASLCVRKVAPCFQTPATHIENESTCTLMYQENARRADGPESNVCTVESKLRGEVMRAPESYRKAALTTDAKADAHELHLVASGEQEQEIGLASEQYGTRGDLEKALNDTKSSEAQLRKIIDTIPTLAWSARSDGSAEFFNRHWLDYAGLSAEEASDWGWTVALHPEDRDRLMRRSHPLCR